MLGSFLLLLSVIWHAIYISVVEIDLDKQNIAVKVFQDDFQDALRNMDNQRYDGLVMENNHQLASQYFDKKLILRNNRQQPIDLSLQKIEAVGDVYWVYFNYRGAIENGLEVRATIFLELFPTQQNIITIKKSEEKFFGRLNKENTIKAFDF